MVALALDPDRTVALVLMLGSVLWMLVATVRHVRNNNDRSV